MIYMSYIPQFRVMYIYIYIYIYIHRHMIYIYRERDILRKVFEQTKI